MLNDQICFVFRKLAIEAGSVIMDIYNQNNFEIKIKNDDSPVTIADEAADKIIYKGLQKAFPDIPIADVASKLCAKTELKSLFIGGEILQLI